MTAVPEFPLALVAVVVFTGVLLGSYFVVRARTGRRGKQIVKLG
jgi:hypothetical protein